MPSRDRKTGCALELDPREPRTPKDSPCCFSRNPSGAGPDTALSRPRVCQPAPETLHEGSSFSNSINMKQDRVLRNCSVKLALEKLCSLKLSLPCSERFSNMGLNRLCDQLNLVPSFGGSHYLINNSTLWLELCFGKSPTIW